MADTQTTLSGVPDWAAPFFKDYLATAQSVAQMPYNPYTGQTVAQLNPYQVQGYNAQASRAMQGSPVTDAASAELQKTLQGGYLNSNPYLSGMIDNASQDVLRNMTNLDARSGSFGNSGIQDTTNRNLAEVAMNFRGNDYSNERNRMMGAIGQAPGIANQDYVDAQQLQAAGQGFQQNNQANLTDQYNRFAEARAYPTQALQTMGSALNQNYGTQSSTTLPSQSPWATGLGTAATLYGLSGGATSKPTVICTELHRQGLMDDETYTLDQAYGAMLVYSDPAVYSGYIKLATPVVERMKQSKAFTRFVWMLAKPWAREMAAQMGEGKGSLIGKLIMAIGYPLCRMAVQREVA